MMTLMESRHGMESSEKGKLSDGDVMMLLVVIILIMVMVMMVMMIEGQHGMESSEKGEVSDGIGDSDGNDGDDDDENGSPTWCSELDVVSDGDDG